MKKLLKHFASFALAIVLAWSFCGCAAEPSSEAASTSPVVASSAVGSTDTPSARVTENGRYTDRDSLAAYIHRFGHLPSNFISKTKARKAGWVSSEGNLWEVLPGMSIGGSGFYNDDGQLPDKPGRRWTECDVGYEGGYRGAERIVFSNDGLIYYTADHYKTFTQLY